MTRAPPDPSAIDGKIAPPAEHAQVLVIGAGPAGTAAAIAAARAGEAVVLIDENPVDPRLMAIDTPLWFGGRMTGAVQRPDRLIEQIAAANPDLETALALGVDVRLGVTAWGLWVPGPALRALPSPMVGLADRERAWMCGFNRLVLASGARDIALAFPGWETPGVMGANGFQALIARYDAFEGRRVAVLGSTDLGLETALLALERGLEVAAVVEALDVPQGSPVLLARVEAAGVAVLRGCADLRAAGGLHGVERLILKDGTGAARRLDVDTICMAVGLAPAIELLQAAGGEIRADARRGGHVPALEGSATSLAGVTAVGDCAGLAPGRDAFVYQTAWLAALQQGAGPGLVICQCEDVTRADLLEVRAPKYLGPPTPKSRSRDLARLAADGPLNQDQIKRLTRACMGVCQARRCREQVALILGQASGGAGSIPLAGFRPPVRPLPLKLIADWDEHGAMSAGWEIWMAIPGQWTPYADIDAPQGPAGP
ncbi:MAG TPA: FAD-dependent oxidoreductase [Caulobacteraceae bacterium]|nr:FAD-dependent oxidoreductase [Caulobacteraceae bacterium]